MKDAILIVSFGTTHGDTREKNIDVIENEVKSEFKKYGVYSAWTSGIIRKKMLDEGKHIDDVSSAMDRMHKDGVSRVYIMTTHLLNGLEYEKLCIESGKKNDLFESVAISKPLLYGSDDLKTVVEVMTVETPRNSDEALVLVGHGSKSNSNAVYAALDHTAKSMEYTFVFVGTLEESSDICETIEAVKRAGYGKAVLVPLMLVAGDHAKNDIASDDENSWKSIFEKSDIECKVILKGLGEHKKIRSLYLRHLRSIMV